MDFNDFKSQLIETILSIKSEIQKLIDPIARLENLTSTQLYILFNIYMGNINTVGGLSKDFGINQGNASTLCKEFEKMGLIVRNRNSKDERVVNIAITQKGRGIIKRFNNNIDKLYNEFKSVSKEKAESIIKGIKDFRELLDNVERRE